MFTYLLGLNYWYLFFLDNKKKFKKGGVNAKRVDNLGIGTVMILDERTIQPGK